MIRVRNLPLAARLGAGFAVVVLALALAAVLGLTGVDHVNGRAAEVRAHASAVDAIGDLAQRSKDDLSLVQQHLYLHDGQLAVEDSLARRLQADYRGDRTDYAALDRLLAGTPLSGPWQRYRTLHARDEQAQRVAVARSRAETVRRAQDRSWSRDYFTSVVLPRDAALVAESHRFMASAEAAAASSLKDANATSASSRRLMLLLVLGAALAAVAVAVAVTRSVTRPVRALGDRMTSLEGNCLTDLAVGLDAVSQGDLTIGVEPGTAPIEVTGSDELGRLSATFNGMLEKARSSIESYNAMRSGLGEAIAEVATGAGTVASASQQMASTSDEAGRAVGEIASAVGDVAQGAERQVRMVEATREAVQEAARAAGSSAQTAQATAAAAEQTREVALDGVRAAEQASSAIEQVAASSQRVGEAIQGLSAKSEQIGGIVDTITGIAEQTNLLALNAAIEAARAGEQGKGFAVVAEEVRKLAEESQRATGQIAELVRDIQAETENAVVIVAEGGQRTADGVATVEQTREAFAAIGSAVEDMTARVSEIAAAVQQISAEAERAEHDINEVAAVAEESSASAEQVSASTQQTSASTQEIASSASELAQTAEQLDGIVSRFKLTV
jgi:methyl-accepting chemotaxis protein